MLSLDASVGQTLEVPQYAVVGQALRMPLVVAVGQAFEVLLHAVVGQALEVPLPALLPLSASPCGTPASLVAPVGKDPSSQGAIPLMTLLLLYAVLLLLLPPLLLWSEGADGGEEAWLGDSAHS